MTFQAPAHPLPLVQPWVSGDLVARIEPVLEEVAEALWLERDTLGPGLASGLAGAALFLGYLGQRPGFQRFADRAVTLLEEAVARIAEGHSPGLYSGFPGVAWAVEHLRKTLFTPEAEDPNTDVDELLLDMLEADGWAGAYDLIEGIVGLGVYGLERLPLLAGRTILARTVDNLERLATPMGPGLVWPTPPEQLPDWQRERCPSGYVNLGMAHGLPGILALLSAIQAHGIQTGLCGHLLESGLASLRWLAQDPGTGIILPAWHPLGEATAEVASCRLAWCYGDLGASVALRRIATRQAFPEWARTARAMASLAAHRPEAADGVKDAGICHGSAGLLLIFKDWYHATGDPVFAAAARRNLDRTLAYHHAKPGFAGFWTAEFPSPEHPQDFEPCAGLLEGAAGVGLVLLSCLEPATPSWTRFLLLSSPEPG